MSPNEVRLAFNLAPREGGDEFVMRLDMAKVDDTTSKKEEDVTDGYLAED